MIIDEELSNVNKIGAVIKVVAYVVYIFIIHIHELLCNDSTHHVLDSPGRR